MKKAKKIIAAFLMVTLLLPLTILKAQAAEFNFAVDAVIPDNQVDKSKTYFDLMMEPGQQQILEMKLRNDTDKDIHIDATVRSATTNINGVVEYGDRDVERDSTLVYALEDLVKIPDDIVIPAQGSTVLELELIMPSEEISGILAGGITLQEAETEGESETSDQAGMSIKNKYAYVVGIVLRTNEEAVAPELVLNDVFPSQVNVRNVINANIQNVKPMYMNNMKVDARITAKGSSENLYEYSAENMQMAPNSNFDFPVALNGQKMQAGQYTLYMTVDSMDETWTWEKDFEITAEVADEYNEMDVSIAEPEPEQELNLFLIVGIALLVLAIILVFIILLRRKLKKTQAALAEARKRLV